MAVAVKQSPETTTLSPLNRLAVSSLLGALYVVLSVAVVFYGIPWLWQAWFSSWVSGTLSSFVDVGLLLAAMVAGAAGLAYVGQRLAGPHAPRGIRAGVFVATAGLLTIGWLTGSLAGLLETNLGVDNPTLGLILAGAVGLLLVVLGVRILTRSGFEQWLVQFEDQGWFTAAPYKRSQGLRTRRGTILGILLLAGCGIYTLVSHMSALGPSWHWVWTIPYSDGQTITLMRDLQFTVPLLLAGASLWLAYRVVNFPPFADFLIATDAEMNKVSWTTRKRLVQDTIVVLVTVVLLTIFLFVVDLAWFEILRHRWIGVLHINPSKAPAAAQQDW
jgi:preprotein translocase SecE subunit